MWLPSQHDVENIHSSLVELFAKDEDPIQPPGIKSQALLESACQRPFTGAGNTDKYKTMYSKSAALFHSLTKNHAFHNGNKRTAVVTLLTVLHRNDKRLSPKVTDDAIYDLAVSVTADDFPRSGHGLDVDGVVQELAEWIKFRDH